MTSCRSVKGKFSILTINKVNFDNDLYLGAHTTKLNTILKEWKEVPNLPRKTVGMGIIKALKNREKPFYYLEGSFNFHSDEFQFL